MTTSITLTINAVSLNDLAQQLEALAGSVPAPIPSPEPETPAKSPAEANGKGKTQTQAKPPATKKNASSKPAAAPDPTPPAKTLTRADVREALTNHLARNDEDATAALLKKHGKVDKLSQLQEAHFQAVFDAASAAD